MTSIHNKMDRSKARGEWFDRKITLHFGGKFVRSSSQYGLVYKYEGGESFHLGPVGGIGLNYEVFHKVVSYAFATMGAKDIILYVLNDGIRSIVDDADDLSIQWQIFPTDEEGWTHFYVVNGDSSGTSDTSPSVIQSQLVVGKKTPINSPNRKSTNKATSSTPSMDTPSRRTRSKTKSKANSNIGQAEPTHSSGFHIKEIFCCNEEKSTPLKKLPIERKNEAIDEGDIQPSSSFEIYVDLGAFGDIATQQSEVIGNHEAANAATTSVAFKHPKEVSLVRDQRSSDPITDPTTSFDINPNKYDTFAATFTEFGDGRDPTDPSDQSGETDTISRRKRVDGIDYNEVEPEEAYIPEHSSDEDDDDYCDSESDHEVN